MEAVILAGGFATRMYPLTENYPKALLALQGKTLISYTLDKIVKLGNISKIYFLSNDLFASKFRSYLEQNYSKNGIVLVNNGVTNLSERLGALGDLNFIIHKENINDDLLVVASDTLTSIDFTKFINYFKQNKGFINAVYDIKDTNKIKNRLGCPEIKGNKIINFSEKPPEPKSSYISIPFYIYPKKSLGLIDKYIKEGNPKDAPGSIIPWLVGKMPVFAYNIGSGYYYDVGTIEDYNYLREHFTPK